MATIKKHDDITRQIWHRPGLIGLTGIVLSVREANLIQPDGNLYHQPDNLCFDPTTRTLYNIEYKTNRGRVKANFQLTQQETWLKHIFPDYQIRNLYVHNNFKVEELKHKKR